jgi:hypothetical protein
LGCTGRIGFFSSGYDHEYVTTGVRSGRIFRIIGFQISLCNYSAILKKIKMQQKKLRCNMIELLLAGQEEMKADRDAD